jgi:hypothetical protein
MATSTLGTASTAHVDCLPMKAVKQRQAQGQYATSDALMSWWRSLPLQQQMVLFSNAARFDAQSSSGNLDAQHSLASPMPHFRSNGDEPVINSRIQDDYTNVIAGASALTTPSASSSPVIVTASSAPASASGTAGGCSQLSPASAAPSLILCLPNISASALSHAQEAATVPASEPVVLPSQKRMHGFAGDGLYQHPSLHSLPHRDGR